MKCKNCNKKIDDDSNFCKYCGTKVVKANVCPKCGAENPEDAVYCPDCGTHLDYNANWRNANQIDNISLSTFISTKVLPFWPKADSGELLPSNNILHLKYAIAEIQNILSNGDLQKSDKLRFIFVEQAITAILGVSNGCTPWYRSIMQSVPEYSSFWEDLKKVCGENKYNPYWHYNSGIFAERLKQKILNL